MTKRLQTHLDSIFSLSEKDFEFLCSAERVRAFGGQESYKEHLLFIQEIYPSLQMIEVLLRNKIDYFFKRAIMQASPFGNEWLLDLYAINFKPLKISSQQNALHKIIVFVSMVRVIRNRISHCEHLLKYKGDQSSIQFDYQDHMFYLKANKDNIVEYLDFLLRDLLLL